jgi:acyl-CoA synthetase (AMP-forming)/AMP-acid ligase II
MISADLGVAAMGSVYNRFQQSRARFGDRPFLHAPFETASLYRLAKTDFTYDQAGAAVQSLMATYDRIGLRPGMRVGLALENRPEFFLHFLAVNGLDAGVSPLNCAMPVDELAFQIAHSECGLIVVAPAHRAPLIAAADGSPLKPIVVTPDELGAVTTLSAHAPASASAAAAGGEAALLYTSGTTGRPKGCILSNDYFTAIGDLYTSLGGHIVFADGAERIITPLPATHMNALACSFMAAVQTGGCLIQLDRFHPKTWWKTVRESGATIMHYLGVMPAMLLNSPVVDGEDFGDQIKFAFGAGCDPRHHANFETRFGVTLIEAWAMTETGAGAWITASHEPRHIGTRCFGRAPEGLEWMLVDEEGRETPPGDPGELLVRRAGADPRRIFFSGYFKDEAATEDAWKDGWFHTGDVVRVDEDGYFYFVDRRKNVIRRSGENIAAIDVESVLMRHPRVAACVVAPVPDEFRGDEVAALIIPSDNEKDEAAAREIFDFAMENLVYFKAPGYIAFVESIPMTASEKVKRGESKTIARGLVERAKCYTFNALKKPKSDGAR